MLDTAVLKQLNDPDPAARKQAVIALAKTLDEEALGYLATVYKKDRDPEIRKLAKKAGLYIRKHTRDLFSSLDSSVDGDGGAVSPFYEEVDLTAIDEVEKPVKVSSMKIERANGMVERAMDADIRGDRDKAIDLLRKALKLNPNLKREPLFSSQAVSLTGAMSTELAIELLLKDEEKKKRGEGDSGSEEEATWGNAFIDLLIYGLVNAAVVGVSMYLFFALVLPPLSEELARLMEVQAANGAQGTPSQLLFGGMSAPEIMTTIMNNFSTPLTLGYSAVYGVASIVFLMIQYIFIHTVSVTLLRGEGSFVRLVTKATLPQAFLIPALTVVSVASSFLPLLNPDLGTMPSLVGLALSLTYSGVLASRIGIAYRFSTGAGCGAMIISSILIGLFGCGLFFILTTLLSSGIGMR